MARIRRGYDWGDRCPKWAGITSQVADIGGTRVHYLRAGGKVNGPTHLLIHPMGAGAWSWMDVIGSLSATGSVIAPDLPGSGRSRPLRRCGGDILAGAQFLDDFTGALGIERVVAHGHSMGGLVAGLFAGQAPDRVERLVLNSTPLPGLPDPPRFPGAWRVGLAVARPVGDVFVGTSQRLKADMWRCLAGAGDSSRIGSALARIGTDASRISPELLSLAADHYGRIWPAWRVSGAVDAALSVVRALTVDEAKTRAGLDAISAPTLLLWGANDRVFPRRLIDEVEGAHPRWSSRTIEGVGHLLPWESPRSYVGLAS
jgi:pimeloyl-ACP methyl ester carboxylesterase